MRTIQPVTGITVAPLVGLRNCVLTSDTHMIFDGLELISAPRIDIDEEWKRNLGDTSVKNLTKTRWGLQYTYDAQPNTHLGPLEKRSDEILKRALIALWVTRPTGASIRHFLRYRRPWHSDNATCIVSHQDWLHPNQRYEKAGLSVSDLAEFSMIATAVQGIFEQKKALVRSIYYLNGALHMWLWDARFVMFTVVLESLFTTDSQEISHKIAERVAWFLEVEVESRRSLYDRMREIYKIRSKIVHGTEIKGVVGEVSESLMADLELYTQRALKKILADQSLVDTFSSKSDEREGFLGSLLFK